MQNFIENIEIKNYKSLENISLKLGKVNILIGENNSGKSNILEAISLLGIELGDKYFSDCIKYEQLSNLFFKSDLERLISVESDTFSAYLKYFESTKFYALFKEKGGKNSDLVIDENTQNQVAKELSHIYINSDKSTYAYNFSESKANGSEAFNHFTSFHNKIRYYKFQNHNSFSESFSQYLNNPFGTNLYSILKFKTEVIDILNPILSENNISIELDTEEHTIKIKNLSLDENIRLPYYLLSESLQRLVFFTSVIMSNSGANILLNKPEINMSGDYLDILSNQVLADNSNQFIISTHSHRIIKNLYKSPNVNVFRVYQDGSSKIEKLNELQVLNCLDNYE